MDLPLSHDGWWMMPPRLYFPPSNNTRGGVGDRPVDLVFWTESPTETMRLEVDIGGRSFLPTRCFSLWTLHIPVSWWVDTFGGDATYSVQRVLVKLRIRTSPVSFALLFTSFCTPNTMVAMC
jgi:hypothetical protein